MRNILICNIKEKIPQPIRDAMFQSATVTRYTSAPTLRADGVGR
jgi:hypothetical protein